MATDNSPVQNRIIVVIGVIGLVSLIGLKFGFDSYFTFMTEEVVHSKLVSADQLLKLRDEEKKVLSSGAMPIDKAMAELASKGRENPGSLGADFAPSPSDDLGPMVGWTKIGNKLPAPAPAPHAAAVGDAGAAPDPHAPAPHSPPPDPGHH